MESFFLDEEELRADKEEEDSEGGVKWPCLQNVDELFFAEVFLRSEDILSNILSSFI